MRVSDAYSIIYCGAKKTTEKLKIHVEYKVLRNKVKIKIKQAKKNYYQDSFEKNKNRSIKSLENYLLYCQCGKKK